MVSWSTTSQEIQDAAALCLPRIHYEILNILYSGDNISSVLWHICRVLLLLPHTSHCFQSKISSWTLAQRPCQNQWMCLYTFKHQVLASRRESFCCSLVFSKGLFPNAQGTMLLQNKKSWVFPLNAHTLCENLRGFIWENREGLHQDLEGSVYFFFLFFSLNYLPLLQAMVHIAYL